MSRLQHEDGADALDRFVHAFPSLRVSAMAGGSPLTVEYQHVTTERFAVDRLRCDGRLHAVGPLRESVAVGRREPPS